MYLLISFRSFSSLLLTTSMVDDYPCPGSHELRGQAPGFTNSGLKASSANPGQCASVLSRVPHLGNGAMIFPGSVLMTKSLDICTA